MKRSSIEGLHIRAARLRRFAGASWRACLLAASLAAAPAGAEVFIDIGAQAVDVELTIPFTPSIDSSDSGPHFGIGIRGDVGEHSSVGARLELSEIESSTYLAVRAFDYAYHFSDRFAITAFLGAARLNLATPAYGYYGGGGVRIKDLVAHWDLGIEFSYGDKVARDNRFPNDPGQVGLANFYDISSISVYLSRSF